jgi:hypothetical protein
MMRIAGLVAWIYGGLCAGALLLIPATTYHWMGVAEDPHAGTFAFILGLPWSLVLQAFGPLELWLSILLVMLGMAMNVLIILWLGYRRSRSRRRL